MDEYVCGAGDTFDLVALWVYGDEGKAYLLMQANPALVHRQVFVGGEVLTIPEEEPNERQDNAPWKV